MKPEKVFSLRNTYISFHSNTEMYQTLFPSALLAQKLRVVLCSITVKIIVSLMLAYLSSFPPSQCQKTQFHFHYHFIDLTIAAFFLGSQILLTMNQSINKIQK